MKNNMNIAFASGKGGTGKTSIAVNFAKLLSEKYNVNLVDLDVEEPDTGIYFTKKNYDKVLSVVTVDLPKINNSLCTRCGLCAKKCNFNALAALKTNVILFDELCKSCGVCVHVCPTQSIVFRKKKIGIVEEYMDENLNIYEGTLDIGNIQTKKLIAEIKTMISGSINVYDCPPGTTCPMVESVKDADFVVLVTEPTPFGLHDLSLAVEAVQKLNRNFGIFINKSDSNDKIIETFCNAGSHTLLGKLRFEKEIAQKCSGGDFIYTNPTFKTIFNSLFDSIQKKLQVPKGAVNV